MAISITLTKLKNELNLGQTHNDHDTELTQLITYVINEVVDYLDRSTITGQENMPVALERPLLKQMSYIWRRRKDPGLSSQAYPDGSVTKWEIDEWLPDTKKILDRHAYITI